MGSSYWPSKEEQQESFAQNLSSILTASAVSYGVLPADAASLATAVSSFVSLRAAANEPATRTEVAVAAKNSAKRQLFEAVSHVVKHIRGTASVSDAQLARVGLRPYDVQPTPRPAPSTRPVVTVLGVSGNSAFGRLNDEATPTSRAKPWDADTAELFAFIGATPPAELTGWTRVDVTSRCTFELTFQPEDAAKDIHLVAHWANSKGEFGPLSEPVVFRLPGAISQAA